VKNSEALKKWQKNYYLKNKDRIKAYAIKWKKENKRRYVQIKVKSMAKTKKARRDKNLAWFLSYLGVDKILCSRCGEEKTYPFLHFHHSDPSQKINLFDSFNRWVRYMKLEEFKEKILGTKGCFLCNRCHTKTHFEIRTSRKSITPSNKRRKHD